MQLDTQRLIIQLMKEELRRSDRRSTHLYHREVEDSLVDFTAYVQKFKPAEKGGAQ